MANRGTRGAYRKEDRVALPKELQAELVAKAAARVGNCQELAKRLNIPKSSVHYYQVGRITMPVSILERMVGIAADDDLAERISSRGIEKDRTWANEYAVSVYREMCREKLRLPTRDDLERDDELRRQAAAIVSYVMAEGSVWLQKDKWGECAVNITFASHETDLYEHFRSLCKYVFLYDIGPPQRPGNGAEAIRGFIYSRFVAEWLMENGVMPGEKSAVRMRLPIWVRESSDKATIVAALQPWCDGEGAVHRGKYGGCAFSLVQSRHTDLDWCILSHRLCHRGAGRSLAAGALSRQAVYDIPVLGYCAAFCRSEILDDVATLFKRLGFRAEVRTATLHLRDDGFWSCIWRMRFSTKETLALQSMGIITQQRKRSRILKVSH